MINIEEQTNQFEIELIEKQRNEIFEILKNIDVEQIFLIAKYCYQNKGKFTDSLFDSCVQEITSRYKNKPDISQSMNVDDILNFLNDYCRDDYISQETINVQFDVLMNKAIVYGCKTKIWLDSQDYVYTIRELLSFTYKDFRIRGAHLYVIHQIFSGLLNGKYINQKEYDLFFEYRNENSKSVFDIRQELIDKEQMENIDNKDELKTFDIQIQVDRYKKSLIENQKNDLLNSIQNLEIKSLIILMIECCESKYEFYDVLFNCCKNELIKNTQNENEINIRIDLESLFVFIRTYCTFLKDDMYLDTIEDLDLSVQSYNCLKRAGITTVKELSEMRYNDLILVKNLGKRSLKEVVNKLISLGIWNYDDFKEIYDNPIDEYFEEEVKEVLKSHCVETFYDIINWDLPKIENCFKYDDDLIFDFINTMIRRGFWEIDKFKDYVRIDKLLNISEESCSILDENGVHYLKQLKGFSELNLRKLNIDEEDILTIMGEISK